MIDYDDVERSLRRGEAPAWVPACDCCGMPGGRHKMQCSAGGCAQPQESVVEASAGCSADTGPMPVVAGAVDAPIPSAGGRASHVLRRLVGLVAAVAVGIAVGLGVVLGLHELLQLT